MKTTPGITAKAIAAVTFCGVLALSACSGSNNADGRSTSKGSTSKGPASTGLNTTAQSQGGASATAQRASLEAMANNVIIPRLDRLAFATYTLSEKLTETCATTTQESLDVAREAWREAMRAWSLTSAFRFGPTGKLRTAAGIAYPINTAKIDKLFAAGSEFTATDGAAVAALGADKRGLGAIEYLLFSQADRVGLPGGVRLPGGVAEPGGAECSFVIGAAKAVDATAGELRDAWTKGSDKLDSDAPFVEQFTNPGKGSMYANQQEAIDAVVNAMITTLTSVGDMTLGTATGKTEPEPNPQAADPGAASFEREAIIARLVSVQTIYGNGTNLSALVAAQTKATGNDADAKFRSLIDKALESLKQLGSPIASLTPTEAAKGPLVKAFEAVDAARVTLRTEVASQLGVTISFSDSDGDG